MVLFLTTQKWIIASQISQKTMYLSALLHLLAINMVRIHAKTAIIAVAPIEMRETSFNSGSVILAILMNVSADKTLANEESPPSMSLDEKKNPCYRSTSKVILYT